MVWKVLRIVDIVLTVSYPFLGTRTDILAYLAQWQMISSYANPRTFPWEWEYLTWWCHGIWGPCERGFGVSPN